MFPRSRIRRGPYALATPSALPRLASTILVVCIIGLVLFFTGRLILRFFGAGNQLERSSVLLIVEARGAVNVSLEGGAVQRADDSLKLYAGDRVSTGGGAHASMLFFDGGRGRLEQQTDVSIDENARGSEQSAIELTVHRGTLFFQSPTQKAFSGSVTRTIHAGPLTLTLPAATELIVDSEGSLQVWRADGLGVSVAAQGHDDTILIGEGQRFTLPPNAERGADLYAFREPLVTLAPENSFLTESRSAAAQTKPVAPGEAPVNEDILSISEPIEGAKVSGSTVLVLGTMNTAVAQVRVNSYPAVLDRVQGTFRQELSLTDEAQMPITVEALDAQGLVLLQMRRTVVREITIPESPAISFPAKDGQTYRTSAAELEIRGSAPAGAAGVLVNDYRLQLFKPGSRTWSYLASTDLGNLSAGKNVYVVTTIDASGNRSAPVTLTILLEEGPEGVVADAGTAAGDLVVTPEALPDNAPLKPGTLTVTGPTPGTMHTATGGELLIEGTTDGATASMWVNDYRLQLYNAGKTTWNYIAKTEFRNLKKGKNVYRIVARNEKSEVLDTLYYVVNY